MVMHLAVFQNKHIDLRRRITLKTGKWSINEGRAVRIVKQCIAFYCILALLCPFRRREKEICIST